MGGGGEIAEGLRDGALQLCQVHHRQRDLGTGGGAGADAHKVVDDGLGQGDHGDGGVVGELGEPVGVVPAGAGLGLLGGDHVVGVLVAHQGGLQGGHQAGVEADPLKDAAGVLQGLVQLGQVHGGGVAELLVVAVAGDGSSAVVPEDQGVAVGGILLGAVFDEVGQVGGIGHGLVAEILLQAVELAVVHLIDLVDGGGDDVVLPLLAAAGADDDVDVLVRRGVQHLLEVCGAHGVLGFQVGAAHIDHDGGGVLAVALEHHSLLTGGGGDGGVDGLFLGRLRGLVAFLGHEGAAGAVLRLLQLDGGTAAGAGFQQEQNNDGEDDEREDASAAAGGKHAALALGAANRLGSGTAALSADRAAGGDLLALADVGGTGDDFLVSAVWSLIRSHLVYPTIFFSIVTIFIIKKSKKIKRIL